MHARSGPRAAKRDNLPDLGECQSEPSPLLDECQDAEHVGRIDSIA